MIALARSSCNRATASSPRVASSACSRERSSPISAGAVSGAGWSSAVARRAQPPMLLTTRAPRRMSPPCSISFWVVVCIALSCMARRSPYWHRPINSSSISRVAPPVPARTARLLEQANLFDLHRSVRPLHHVVDREQGDRHRRQRLHFHARPPDCLRGGPHSYTREPLVQRRVDFHVIQAQRVAEGDQLGRPLRRQRSRHLAHRQHVALGHLLIGHEPERLARHPDRAFRHRRADCDGLVAHVHHPCPACFVHVRQLHAGSPPSSRCANADTMLSGSLATRTRTTRDRIVGSSESGAAVVKTNTVSAGGSSNALSNALAAASAPV